MGRLKKEVYEYEFNGKFIRKWDCVSDFRKHYYTQDVGKRPLFVNKIKGLYYHVTHYDTIALFERPGRDNIKFIVRIIKSELCNFNKNEGSKKPIQMFNLNDELIAEFSSLRVAEYLINIPRASIEAQIKKRGNRKTKGLVGDYYFEYKN